MEKNFKLVKNNLNELPNNIEAEQAVIGSILLNNEIFDEISIILSSKNFYDPIHIKIYGAIEKLIYGGMLANPITLKNHFENQKDVLNIPDYLINITKFSTSTRQALEYSKLIYDLYVKRELIKISENIIDSAKLNDLDQDGQKIIENFEKSLFDLAEKGSFSSSLVKFDEAMKLTIEMASNAYKNEEGIVGVPTGMTDLDDRLGGLHKSDLVIIAGRPSMGKTALATNIAFNAAKKIQDDGRKSTIAFFSLEMSSGQLVDRMLAAESKVDAWRLRTGKVRSDSDFGKLRDALDRLSKAKIHIDDQAGNTTLNMRSVARRIKRESGLDLIIIDYLQLMSPSGRFKNSDSMVQQVTEISRSLKILARELDVPVLALSQLSRAVEQRGGKPRLSDLRDSGSIEQDADVVMFIHREREEVGRTNHAEILIEKHRNGPVGRVEMMFDPDKSCYLDIEQSDYDTFANEPESELPPQEF